MDDNQRFFDFGAPRKRCPFPVPLDVCHLFEKLTIDLWNAGWAHYSARAVLHRIRWEYHVEKRDRTFKCNNNWTPALARWVMGNHAILSGFYRTRASPKKGGQPHSGEDYMGPYAS